MPSELDELIDRIAAIDPDKAAHLRWIRPQSGEATLVEMARGYLATQATQGPLGGNPNATLLDLELGLDPDEPTVRLPPGAEENMATLSEDEDGW